GALTARVGEYFCECIEVEDKNPASAEAKASSIDIAFFRLSLGDSFSDSTSCFSSSSSQFGKSGAVTTRPGCNSLSFTETGVASGGIDGTAECKSLFASDTT